MPTPRETRQRAAIARVLAEARGPLLPETVLRRAQQHAPRLGQATVYRTLKRLAADGAIRAVRLADERVRYEAAKGHHHHFHCRGCDEVLDVAGCGLPPPSLAGPLPPGFTVERHELILIGLCARCA